MSLSLGKKGERKTRLNLWFSLSSRRYNKFHNIIILGSNGTTQIDHLIISRYGIFIVETKNTKGWIFGSENQPSWTQSFYGKNYKFQNPLRQTFRQKKVLSEVLKLNESKIYQVIYFAGDCKFKTSMPPNVVRSRLGRYIKSFKEPVLNKQQVKEITIKLSKYLSKSKLTSRDHRQSLTNRHSSNSTCPKCGANLVERVAKKGPNMGSRFLGCSSYPKCRFTRDL